MDVLCRHFTSIQVFPLLLKPWKDQHGLDVVQLQHAHWSPDLLHGWRQAKLPEHIFKGLDWGKGTIVYCCAGPVQNHRFYFSHAVRSLTYPSMISSKV